MVNKMESWFFGKVWGRVSARLIVSATSWIVGFAAAKGLNINPVEVSAILDAAAQGAYTWAKDFRDKRAANAAKP